MFDVDVCTSSFNPYEVEPIEPEYDPIEGVITEEEIDRDLSEIEL